MGHITESTWERQTAEAQFQSDPCFNTHFFSSVDGIWLKATHNYHLMLKKSVRPHWCLQVESWCTRITFPKLYGKSKTQLRLNLTSSKPLLSPQTIALCFLLPNNSQLKGYGMAAWTHSATRALVRSTTERRIHSLCEMGRKQRGTAGCSWQDGKESKGEVFLSLLWRDVCISFINSKAQP